MPALTFLAVVGLVLVALLFVADATLEIGLPVIVTSQRSGLSVPWHPDPIGALSAAPTRASDMTSKAVLAAEPKPASEAPTTIGPAARAARAEAPPKNRRVTQPIDRRVTRPIDHQQNQFDRFSIKGY